MKYVVVKQLKTDVKQEMLYDNDQEVQFISFHGFTYGNTFMKGSMYYHVESLTDYRSFNFIAVVSL